MDFIEKLLESVCESMRRSRRYGMVKAPKFPTVFDLSHIKYDLEFKRIELELQDAGKTRKFHLVLIEIKNDGI